jgi:GFO/IDH/MocA oxidoreductase family protein
MLPALRAVGQDVRVIYSSDLERARLFARAHALDVGTSDLHRALDPGVDAVYISSRNDRHRADVLAAAEAGKHVLCEKPLATTMADAASMVEACAARGVVLATDRMPRSGAGETSPGNGQGTTSHKSRPALARVDPSPRVCAAAPNQPIYLLIDEKQGVLAERGGFEPPMDRIAHTGFRDRRIQPLCHLSGVRRTTS